ncbi:DUF1707 domain-containing protein [Actinocrispum sp. NPDC049592]|uniref:DUF1707 SHOCT-like domain-containing protein n=1 Tax=Actinocrispum sp. NPDC049592 TaxID=3154835 RepID=UPI00344912FB
MSEPVDPRTLRVSDAEREHVVAVLQKAIGQGLITLDEFTTRTDTALAAKTRSELNAVLIDLPGLVHPETQPAATAKPRLELRNTMSKLRRSGRWAVPRELIVRNKMGSCDLDFSDADIQTREVDVELDITAGSVRILLPQHATVDTDDVQLAAGSLHNKISRPQEPGGPHFRIRGIVRAGSVKIKRPTYLRLGSLVIRFPWKVSTDR